MLTAIRERDEVASSGPALNDLGRICAAAVNDGLQPAETLRLLVTRGLDRLPAPGSSRTLVRWRALSDVAASDLSLVKLYEGHTDALAIMSELGDQGAVADASTWGMWAAEPPDARVLIDLAAAGRVRLRGRKSWCSGAAGVSHALLTAWGADGRGPWLVKVALKQPGVRIDPSAWAAVGMSASESADVHFDNAWGDTVGEPGDYLARPGFWQGGAGIAACWLGGARAIADHLRAASGSPDGGDDFATRQPFRAAALGKVDVSISRTLALLREAAAWIDLHPRDDASAVALRARLSAEETARVVLDETGRALGAGPFCRDPRFARLAADLPVFVRQSHAERDFAALGARAVASGDTPWRL